MQSADYYELIRYICQVPKLNKAESEQRFFGKSLKKGAHMLFFNMISIWYHFGTIIDTFLVHPILRRNTLWVKEAPSTQICLIIFPGQSQKNTLQSGLQAIALMRAWRGTQVAEGAGLLIL